MSEPIGLRQELLIICGQLADGEEMPKLDAEIPLQRLVVRLAANVSPTTVLLLAVTMAKYIDG